MNDFIKTFVPMLHLQSPVIIDILDNSERVQEPEPTILLSASQIQETIYFITEGVIRRYSIEDDQEKTNWFFSQGDIAVSEDSFYIDAQSDEFLETTFDTQLLAIKKKTTYA